MTRRQATKALLVSTIGVVAGAGRAQAPAPQRIAELGRLGEVGSDVPFDFARQKALLVRVPPPQKPNPRVLQAGSIYLTAFSRTCTHAGCIVPLPDQRGLMECGCHGSRFRADGVLLDGPAPTDLRAIALELRQNEVWAVGWLENP
ncbi:ubiquinol-cytochrome c reductase iron-sulfur subunit [Meiothermus sp.]|uniref:QcrA and Rieske domain-containing protein n=1 Tax=Meiothermus sp. TaxID=1955249 RepID=UPI0021DDA69A|nr:Rieske 2Fe-2S domain-containing protein [Meiothermus sp.]GIW32982.1 MAG: hypothetical protein KatS3mg072_0315 [Meiothermus sp.]